MTLALALAGGLCYFIGTCRVGSGTYHSLGSGVFIGFICGLVYGDITTGLLIGASINLVYLGVVAPAGQIPSDEIMASSVAIPLALAGGLSAEMAVSLAVPFGLLGVFLDQIRRTTNIYWLHKADKYAAEGNESDANTPEETDPQEIVDIRESEAPLANQQLPSGDVSSDGTAFPTAAKIGIAGLGAVAAIGVVYLVIRMKKKSK